MADDFSVAVDGIALAAATAKTVLEIATPSTRSATLIQFSVEFDGTSAAVTPVKVELMRGSATITGTTITPVKFNDPLGPNALATAKYNATGEGTATDLIETHRVSPTAGYEKLYPLGREPQIGVSSFLRLRLTAAAAVNAAVTIVWEE